MPKLIVFAGLPGTGKTTLAQKLAPRINAVLLNKDEIRAALFATADIEYSDAQNDFCMEVVYQLAAFHLSRHPHQPVIIDGRTYSKRSQIEALLKFANTLQCQLHIIECQCSPATAQTRLADDQGKHLAADRTVELYAQVQAHADPLDIPRLTLTTDQGSLEDNLNVILHYVTSAP